ncbi:ferritin-like domain-containing protein [Sphingomonas bacterium]|uniref:ferritin-like domain-containing protein n=1 Tax=Sphingomonas bacterium TaxID=1895847 RepID=UPI001575994F|nr:ferritin-like domain-containing protein [Sphingomonas bacterium]
MNDQTDFIEVFDARARRRSERRDLFKAVLGTAAVGVGAFALASPAAAQTVTDSDILNFALNLEYLEAQFYIYAYTGAGLPAAQQTGTGTQGAVVVTGATAQPRKVDFSGEPLIGQYAREIAADEAAHVAFLRTALGTATVAQPALNISGDANGAFTAAARAAGIATVDGTATGAQSNTGTFDPYSSPLAFLLGAFIFEDVGVTAYKGASPLITNNIFLDAAAGILATEAFHAGIIRGSLYARGVAAPALRTAADKISDARDGIDGTSDDDQGISPVTVSLNTASGANSGTASNFVPTDGNGIVYSRSTGQVLNIVYLNRNTVTMGGFFPAGTNGNIRSSAAN